LRGVAPYFSLECLAADFDVVFVLENRVQSVCLNLGFIPLLELFQDYRAIEVKTFLVIRDRRQLHRLLDRWGL
jgi:hypothetical protein